MNDIINIAIDGPAGAGKSTISKLLAKNFGFIYVDTGALYRAVGLLALELGASDAAAVESLLPNAKVEIRYAESGQRVYLNGRDVSEEIRTPEVSMAASRVSAIPAVRAFLLDLQKDIAAKNNVVMDGRDIGTVVLPNARVKIFLTASPEDRARRRYEEMVQKGMEADYSSVLSDIIKRDRQDSERDIAPLKPAPDAELVDTTGDELPQSLERLSKIVRRALK